MSDEEKHPCRSASYTADWIADHFSFSPAIRRRILVSNARSIRDGESLAGGETRRGPQERIDSFRENDETFLSLFNQAPVGAAVVSLAYRFIRVNDALCRITGYSAEELLDRGFPDITHPDDLQSNIELAERLMVGEIDRYSMDKRYIRKSGETVWVRLSVGLFRDKSGQPAWFLPVVEDISERKQAEAEMRDMRDKLRNLAIHLLSAREEERRKIAQEIHDELGQALTAMKMDLRWVEKRMGPGTGGAPGQGQGSRRNGGPDDLHGAAHCREIRPRMLDDLGLAAALEWLGKDFQRRTGIRCDVITDFPESMVGGNASTTLYRIAQEALTNVARHSEAHRVSVQFRKNGGAIELRDCRRRHRDRRQTRLRTPCRTASWASGNGRRASREKW